MIKNSRRITSVLVVFFIVMAAVFCCCSQVLALTQHPTSSCCHKDASPMDSIAGTSSGHQCHCPKIEGALPQDPEFKNLISFSHLNFNDLQETKNIALSLSSSQYTPQELSYCHSSPTPLYLQVSVLRV